MPNTRVCYFIERWSSGGIEAFITNMLTKADLTGISFDIVAARLEESIYTDRLKSLGVGFFELSGSLRSPKNARLFKKRLTEGDYDIVHLHIFHGLALDFARIARRHGVKEVIAHSHGAGLRKSATHSLKLLLHKISRAVFGKYPTRRVACSRDAGEFLFGHGCDFEIINNGIDTEKYRFDEAARKDLREELMLGDGIVLGHVGRFSSEKNHAFLLEVFRAYKDLHADARFIVVGTGELDAEIKERARALGIYGDVVFFGLTDRIPELLSAMDAFVFPSIAEGLGIAAIEAIAAGLPLLTSTGVPSAVRITENSSAMPLGDANAWAVEIDRLLTVRRDRYRGADTARAAGFDAKDTSAELISLYRKQ